MRTLTFTNGSVNKLLYDCAATCVGRSEDDADFIREALIAALLRRGEDRFTISEYHLCDFFGYRQYSALNRRRLTNIMPSSFCTRPRAQSTRSGWSKRPSSTVMRVSTVMMWSPAGSSVTIRSAVPSSVDTRRLSIGCRWADCPAAMRARPNTSRIASIAVLAIMLHRPEKVRDKNRPCPDRRLWGLLGGRLSQ